MTVEIGRLTIKTIFANDSSDDATADSNTAEAIALIERRILDKVIDMISDAFRRQQER